MRTALLVVAAIVGAGCVGSGGASDAVAPTVSLEPNQGLIGGRVFDTELRPLAGATVGIGSLGMTQTAAVDGRFLFGALAAGSYEVSAYALGYQASGKLVKVEPGQQVDVTFALEILAAEVAYYESFPYTGFQSCQWYFDGAIAHCTLPYTAAYGAARQNGVNLSAYGAPRDLQDNRDRYNFTVGADHTGIVSELFWQASSAAATWQTLILACGWYDPVWDECVPPGETNTGRRYHFVVGKNPVRHEWKMNEAQLAYLKRSPWVMSRANVYGSEDIAAGFALEQKIQMYNTVFYGAPPPEGFSLGTDG